MKTFKNIQIKMYPSEITVKKRKKKKQKKGASRIILPQKYYIIYNIRCIQIKEWFVVYSDLMC